MNNDQITPEQAKEITRIKQVEADVWNRRVKRLVASLEKIQKENGFAPKMALAYQRSK